MTAKEYLNRAYYIRLQIKDLDERVAELRHRMSSVGAIRYDKISVQSSPDDPMLRYIGQLMDAEQKLLQLEAELEAVSAEIRHNLARLDNEVYRTILSKRYLYHRSIVRIASEIGYSVDHTWKLHRAAIKAFEQVLGDDDEQ